MKVLNLMPGYYFCHEMGTIYDQYHLLEVGVLKNCSISYEK